MNKNYDDFDNLQQKEVYSILKEMETLNHELSDLNSSFVLSSNYLTRTISEYLNKLNKIGQNERDNNIASLEIKISHLSKNIERKKEIALKLKTNLDLLDKEFFRAQGSMENIIALIKQISSKQP
jgi:predicted RNase H-like nuclease (RuvC/YqgF family)